MVIHRGFLILSENYCGEDKSPQKPPRFFFPKMDLWMEMCCDVNSCMDMNQQEEVCEVKNDKSPVEKDQTLQCAL